MRPTLLRLIGFVLLLTPLWIFAAQPLKVVTENLPPYQIVSEGELVGGTSYKLVQQALSLAEIDSKIEVYPWARAYEIARTTPNVLIFSMARTPIREPLFHWLYKLKPLDYYFFSSKRNKGINITSIEDAKRYVAVVVRGSYEAELLKQHGFAVDQNLVVTPDVATAWAMLDRGRAQITYAASVPKVSDLASVSGYKRHKTIIQSHDLYIAASIGTSTNVMQALTDALKTTQARLDSFDIN